ncbi:MAG: hypothetical protein JWN22_3202 [Nocardioides sp.]|jgi:hypothetical protein|nr:hypothetical protein [Nocardioides sp.]
MAGSASQAEQDLVRGRLNVPSLGTRFRHFFVPEAGYMPENFSENGIGVRIKMQ